MKMLQTDYQVPRLPARHTSGHSFEIASYDLESRESF